MREGAAAKPIFRASFAGTAQGLTLYAEAWIATAVLMAALPQALNVFVMARQYDTWVGEASSSVLLGTLISVVTLTAVMWLVKTHALPLHLFR